MFKQLLGLFTRSEPDMTKKKELQTPLSAPNESDVKITARGGTKECPQCGVTTVKSGLHKCPHCDHQFSKADRKKAKKQNKGRKYKVPRSNFGLTMVYAAPGNCPVNLTANNPNNPTDDEILFWAEAVQEFAKSKNQYYNVNVLKSFLAQYMDSQSERYLDLCEYLTDLEYGIRSAGASHADDDDFHGSQQDFWEDHLGGYGGHNDFYRQRTGIGFQYGNTGGGSKPLSYYGKKPDVQERYPRDANFVLEDDGVGIDICFENAKKEKKEKSWKRW